MYTVLTFCHRCSMAAPVVRLRARTCRAPRTLLAGMGTRRVCIFPTSRHQTPSCTAKETHTQSYTGLSVASGIMKAQISHGIGLFSGCRHCHRAPHDEVMMDCNTQHYNSGASSFSLPPPPSLSLSYSFPLSLSHSHSHPLCSLTAPQHKKDETLSSPINYDHHRADWQRTAWVHSNSD